MIFKPRTAARMWDTWLYYHEGTHYLFYLHITRPQANWDGMGVATSTDGVHFVDRGPIIHKAPDAAWLGTGMVWRAGDRFMLNFSEERDGIQEIFFAESDDLLHWRRLPDQEYICRADPQWYNYRPAFASQRWDCIWVLPRDDAPGYIGFLTAVAKDGPPGLCGTAGCVVSDDGRHFRSAPPAIQTGFWGDRVEVGAVERLGGRYYMLLGVYEMGLGSRHLSRLPGSEGGMYVLTSEQQAGPYHLDPRQPLLIGSSPHLWTYFARFYRCGDALLFNHHTVSRKKTWWDEPGGDVYFAPLKQVAVDQEGILSLHWWPGNEALKGKAQPVLLDGCQVYGAPEGLTVAGGRLCLAAPAAGIAMLPPRYDLARGVVLEADLISGQAGGPLSGAGLLIEGDAHHTGTLLHSQNDGRLAVGEYNGYCFRAEDGKPLPYTPGRRTHWRLLVRGEQIELYVDDELIQNYTLAHKPGGRLGFVVEAGSLVVENVRVWEMSL